MINVIDLAQNDTQLKRAASTGGGELSGPCPFCGGRDRFRVQPFNKEGGRWFCRKCGGDRWNDVIDYLMRRNNISFPEAKRIVDGESPIAPFVRKPAPVQAPQHQAEYDVEVWQARAREFATYCEDNLIGVAGDETAKWLRSRGINDDISVRAHLGYNPKDILDAPEHWGYPASHERVFLSHGLVIPNVDSAGFHAIKIRRPDAEKKYTMVKGSNVWLYGGWTCGPEVLIAMLFESELDALVGLSSGYGAGYLAIPAGQHIKPCHQYILDSVEAVVVMPDHDDAGQAHAVALAKIPDFYAGKVPPTGKDISEYHQSTGLDMGKLLDFLYDCAGLAVKL